MIGLSSQEIEQQFAALPSLRWSEFKRFLDAGVPAPGLVWPELPARALVAFLDDRLLFDFADDGDDDASAAFIFIARDEAGEPRDLVAWSPRQRRTASSYGAVNILGAENLLTPRIASEALAIFESPLDWLRAGRRGVVIVDPFRAAFSLANAGPLAAQDAAHARRLRELLKPPTPRVVTGSAISARAA